MLCGVVVHVIDGKATKIVGDPEHPFSKGYICGKTIHFPEFLYSKSRMLYPLKRVGARGEGKWQRILWDEALETVAKRLLEVREKYGPLAIAGATGSPSERIGYVLLLRELGTPNEMAVTDFC